MSRHAIVCGGTERELGPGITIVDKLRARNEKYLLLISDKVTDGIILKI
jgi:hypothetical protein